MLNIIGQLGPLIGTHLYPESDGPYYVKGMAVCAGFMAAVAALSLGLRYFLAGRNRGTVAEYAPVHDEDDGLGERKGREGGFQFML